MMTPLSLLALVPSVSGRRLQMQSAVGGIGHHEQDRLLRIHFANLYLLG